MTDEQTGVGADSSSKRSSQSLSQDAQDGPSPLLLWVLALGLAPAGGWYRAAGQTNDQMKALGDCHGAEVSRLRVMQAIGAMLREEQLAALLRARLAEQVLAAGSAKELYEAVRVYEKLPASPGSALPDAVGDGQDQAVADEFAGMDLEAAVAEARKLMNELDQLPTPEKLAKAGKATILDSAVDGVAGAAGGDGQ